MKVKRWGVFAKLDDGRKILLRDFHYVLQAERFAYRLSIPDLYQGHKGTVLIESFELEEEDD